MNKPFIFCLLLLCSPAVIFAQAGVRGEGKGYIVGTFLSGLGEHLAFHGDNPQGFGTCVEIIRDGNVDWAKDDVKDRTRDTTVSWPLIFDLKLISRFGFGLTFGDLFTISMNDNYRDANHLYFGFSYVYPIYRLWDIGASLIVFPVYVTDDALIAGKIDASYWIWHDIGITASAMFGGTYGWSGAAARVWLFSVSMGISVKF
jgi:hypothetical protein